MSKVAAIIQSTVNTPAASTGPKMSSLRNSLVLLCLAASALCLPHHTPDHHTLLATCDLIASPGSTVAGRIQLSQELQGSAAGPVLVAGAVGGLSPGLHGFHLHQNGDTGDGCKAAGPHFNPQNVKHGSPTDASKHAGDFGNIQAGQDGVANLGFQTEQISLNPSAWNAALGRAIVVHALPDDLGRGGTEESTKTGSAGARLACCVVTA